MAKMHPLSQKAAQGADTYEQGADIYELGARLWTKQRPLHKVPTQRVMLDLEDCAGRICASSIIPYPPGIPLICPGEELGQEEIDYIKELRRRGENVIGLTAANQIAVGR